MAKKVSWFVKEASAVPDNARIIRIKGKLTLQEEGGAVEHVDDINFTVSNDPDFEVIKSEAEAIIRDLIELERIKRDKVAVLEDIVEDFIFTEDV